MTSREDSAPEVVAASSAMMGRIPVEGEVAEEVSSKYLEDLEHEIKIDVDRHQ